MTMQVANVDNCLRLQGRIEFENAESVRKEGERLLRQQSSGWRIDLSGLKAVSSVAVAVMLAWLRMASSEKRDIVFFGASERLLDIVRVSGLETTLSLNGGGEVQ